MKKVVSIVLALIIIACVFTGCKKTINTSTTGRYSNASSLVIGVQNTQCCTVPNLTETVMKDIENTTSFNGSNVSVYELDGHAYEVMKNINVEFEPGLSKSNQKEEASDYAYETISAMLTSAKPLTPEVDILYALTAMSNKLQNLGNDNKHLIVITNLLSTAGIINFTRDTIYFDIDNYISEYLYNELPNMHGVDVTFYIAETESPQKALQNSDIARLKEFYKKLCIEAGANSVEFFEDNTRYDVENTDTPMVSCVDIRINEYKSTEDDIDIVLEESALFLPDSTEFVDEAKTEKDLRSIVKAINNSEGKTLIFGSTATTNGDSLGHLEFGLKRAKTIYLKLVELGANQDKLEYYSLGKEKHTYRVNDTGKFATEENRTKNRCVFIVSEKTEKGKDLQSFAQKYAINH